MGQHSEPLMSRWTQVGDYRVHTRVSMGPVPADRPPLVLVHGQVVSSRYWVPAARELAPHYRVFAPDLPGFGRSEKPRSAPSIPEMADALSTWMDAIGMERAILVANSLGCQILADFAVRYPEKVIRLVLQGPTTDPSARTSREQARRWLKIQGMEPMSLGPILLVDYAQAGLRRAFDSFRKNVLGDRIEEKLPHIQAPALVVRGEMDPIVPQDWAEEVTRLLPCARLVVIPGAAHTINYAAVRDFVRVILTYLDQDLEAIYSPEECATLAESHS